MAHGSSPGHHLLVIAGVSVLLGKRVFEVTRRETRDDPFARMEISTRRGKRKRSLRQSVAPAA
jgi:hypothetical protein